MKKRDPWRWFREYCSYFPAPAHVAIWVLAQPPWCSETSNATTFPKSAEASEFLPL